jgi:hypothetical protein
VQDRADRFIWYTSDPPFSAGRTAVAVSASFESTCAVLSDGNATCWGNGRRHLDLYQLPKHENCVLLVETMPDTSDVVLAMLC